jgi:hypothetical protein
VDRWKHHAASYSSCSPVFFGLLSGVLRGSANVGWPFSCAGP